MAIDAAIKVVAVVLTVTVGAVPDETLNELAPGVEPSVQLPSVATPFVVVALPPVTEPPPVATANVTTVPLATLLPN